MLAYTLFEIRNSQQLDFRYRLLKVRERLPDDNYRPVRVQKWADEMWRRRLKCPVFPRSRDTDAYFIMPADVDMTNADLTFKDVPHMTYHVDPTDEIISVDLRVASGADLEFVASMVERAFSDTLRNQPNYWRDTWTRFFRVSPDNQDKASDIINAYRGFSFGVTSIRGGRLFLAVDVATRYVSRLSLLDYRDRGLEEQLREHCDVRMEHRRAFLRDNGPVKFGCFYAGDTGQTIAEFWLEELNETVLEYYRRRYPQISSSLSPDEEAVYYVQDKERGTAPFPVPVSRLFPRFTTEHIGLRQCSIPPQLSPQVRMKLISEFLQDLGQVCYGDVPLDLSFEPLHIDGSFFQVPGLEFGQGHIIRIDALQKRTNEPYPIRHWGPAKIKALYERHPFHTEPLPVAFLLCPNTLSRRLREEFVQRLVTEVKLQSGLDLSFSRQIPYAPDLEGRNLISEAETLVRDHRRALLVCVLPSEAVSQVHPLLKETCRSVFSQCIHEGNVQEVCVNRSKLRNLALGVLIATGSKPWVLADLLHQDLYVGIDVQDSRVVYTYLFGKGGREMRRRTGSSGGKEAIKTRRIRDELLSSVKQIATQGFHLESIIFHRDGRIWPKESEGIEDALNRLRSEGIIGGSVRHAIVELRKTHLPVRIFSVAGPPNDLTTFQNPFPGCYLILDEGRAIITTTGKPEKWDEQGKTARTLLVSVAQTSGAFDIRHVAEDVFRLTQFNWNAPDIDISMPVTVRWDDELLRETLLKDED